MSYTGWESTLVGRKKISAPMTRKTSGPAGRKILVVDDNAIVLHVISCIMTGADYEVTAVRGGMAALNALRQQDFDLLITDLVMPGMDGIALLKKAKALYPHLRVIILTGSPGLVPQPLEGIDVDALLAKPVYRADLLGHVAYCLNRHDPKMSNMTRPVYF